MSVKRSKHIFMSISLETYQEVLDYLDGININIKDITENKLKEVCIFNKQYKRFIWMAYDFLTEENPMSDLYVQYSDDPPVIGIPFYNSQFEVCNLLKRAPRLCVPEDHLFRNIIITENGLVYKNGELHEPKLINGHLSLRYKGDKKSKPMRVDELIWNSFAKNKLKGNETVKHINGKEEDCHILNLQVERKKSGKNAKIKIIRTNSNDKKISLLTKMQVRLL